MIFIDLKEIIIRLPCFIDMFSDMFTHSPENFLQMTN